MYKRRKCCMQNNFNSNLFENNCNHINSSPNYNSNCSCGFDDGYSVFPTNYMFGQSYVPIHQMNNTFLPEVGLEKGTIFPELVDPYKPCQSIEEINYIANSNKIGEGCNG